MKNIKVLIITGFGLNCQKETSKAFELADALPKEVFINDLIKNPKQLLDFHILCFIGGFSFGDHLGSGTVMASKIKLNIHNELKEFIAQGKLIIGICNGFQTLTRLNIFGKVALAHNNSGVFRNSWVNLKINPKSPCIWTKGIDKLELPIRHGEGKFICENTSTLNSFIDKELIAMQYADQNFKISDEFPNNPNGSILSIAGVCNESGRVFALMPHPEAYLSPLNHPHWLVKKRNNELESNGCGLKLFKNAVNFAEKELK